MMVDFFFFLIHDSYQVFIDNLVLMFNKYNKCNIDWQSQWTVKKIICDHC